MLLDADVHNGGAAAFLADVEASRETDRPVLRRRALDSRGSSARAGCGIVVACDLP
jgi:hypothetical protein